MLGVIKIATTEQVPQREHMENVIFYTFSF